MNEISKILNDLNALDAQYLSNYPTPIKREEYLNKRAALKTKFEKIKGRKL